MKVVGRRFQACSLAFRFRIAERSRHTVQSRSLRQPKAAAADMATTSTTSARFAPISSRRLLGLFRSSWLEKGNCDCGAKLRRRSKLRFRASRLGMNSNRRQRRMALSPLQIHPLDYPARSILPSVGRPSPYLPRFPEPIISIQRLKAIAGYSCLPSSRRGPTILRLAPLP